MLPVLRPGQVVLAAGFYRQLRLGDVVIVKHDGLEKVKRIERIDFQQARVYLLGDNQAQSTDSRTLGWFEVAFVRGKVIWPRTPKR